MLSRMTIPADIAVCIEIIADGSIRTCPETIFTTEAFVREKTHFRREQLGFGIAAPPAAQITAFCENRRSHSGSVVNRIALDIGHNTGRF